MDLNCDEIYLVKRNISDNGLWVDNRSDYRYCKIICFKQGHSIVLWIFNVLDFLITITWKLTETNSRSFWEYGHYWVILSFLSCLFFPVFCFFSPAQRSRLQCKSKFIFPYVLCFYKSRHHINVVLHTPSFLSNSSHIVLKKSQALESFNDIYKQSKQ